MDFITCENGCNAIFTCVDRLTKYTVLTAYTLAAGELSAKQVAQLFSQGVVRQFGLLDNVVHDKDQHFTADFQTGLWNTLGSHVIFNSAYRP